MKKRIIIQIILFSIALCFRISFYLLDGNISRDGIKYILLAEEWNQTGDYEHALASFSNYNVKNWVPPLLPGILLFFIKVGLDPLSWAVGFNILCGALLVIPVFEIGYILSGEVFVSTLAGFLVACNSSLCINNADVLRESTYLLFSAIMLLFACKAINTKKNWFWIGAGVFQGLSFLCRFEAMEYWAWMGIYLFYLVFEKRKDICWIGLNYYASSVFIILLFNRLLGTEKQILNGISRMMFHLTGNYI